MNKKNLISALLVSAVLAAPAFAQSNQPAGTLSQPANAAPAPMTHATQWRASKLIGLNVYNEQNEKLGDVNELVIDQTGQIAGVVIGVGGFLGMGEHDVMVSFDKLKWVNEPIRTSATNSSASPSGTTGSGANAPATRSTTNNWSPDHAILVATKDQLKSMPQFKFN